MKYSVFLAGASALIVANLLSSLIKAAVNPYQLCALLVLLVLVAALVFAIRDAHTVSDVIKINASHVKVFAFLALIVGAAGASIVYFG